MIEVQRITVQTPVYSLATLGEKKGIQIFEASEGLFHRGKHSLRILSNTFLNIYRAQFYI